MKRKIACFVLTSVMLFSTIAGVTGCSKKGANGTNTTGNGVSSAILNEVVEIEEDSEWFDLDAKTLDIIPNPDKYTYSFVDMMYPIEDGYIVTYAGYGAADVDEENHVVKLDKDFNIVSDEMLTAETFGVREGTSIYVESITVINGDVYASVSTFFYDEKTFDYDSDSFFYNLSKKEVVDFSYVTDKFPENSYVEGIGMTDSGIIYLIVYGSTPTGSTYELYFAKDGELLKTIDLYKASSMKDIWFVEYVSSDSHEAVFSCKSMDDEQVFLTINTDDWSTDVSEATSEVSSDNVYIADDGKEYQLEKDGVYCDGEIVMPYKASYVNIEKLQYGTILHADNDRFVIQNTDFSNDTGKLSIYTFTRAASNPNIGKTVLKLGCFGYPYGSTAEAISLFNQTNEKYFLELDIYDIYDGYNGPVNEGDYNDYIMSNQSKMTNELTMDLLNGEGPDLILDAATIGQLNTEEYLYDISDIASGIDKEVFDNVIEASKVDGKLFHMPLSFQVDGIYALQKNVKGEKGFTFDEYIEYVDKVCNGKNPMLYMSRNEVLSACLNAMSDEFFDENGNVSFKNEAFYSLAAYCLENVPETVDFGYPVDVEYYEGIGVGYSIGDDETLAYTQLYSIYSYIAASQMYKDDLGFYGLPSFDGRGPAIEVTSSIAISAACSDYEGAKEFIEFIFSNEADSIWSELYTNPITIDGCRANSKKEVDSNNKTYDHELKFSSEAELHSYGLFRVDDSIIDEYINILKSADTVLAIDPSIFIIVKEEIPSYFAGQKKIEDVAAVIEDRAQTVIDER